jgi:signal transduction histidine kinase
MLANAISSLRTRWAAADLATQFALTAALVIGTSMALLGWWVGGRIERGVVSHAAASASLHMDIFIEPQLQDLTRADELSPVSKAALKALVAVTDRDHQIVDVTVWGKYGKQIYSTSAVPSQTTAAGISTQVPSTTAKMIQSAWNGGIQSAYETAASTLATAPSNTRANTRPITGVNPGDPVLKVFAPMHETGTSRVIAVAELDTASPALTTGLRRARMQTTGVVGLLSFAMVASLFGIVRRGSTMIREQRQTLEERVKDLTALLAKNDELQTSIMDVNHRATDRNDKALRRIGAELHDGPVQLIALGLLRLETLKLPGLKSVERRNDDDLEAIEQALRDALKEIRDLCSGLALPNLEDVSIAKVIDYAVMNHERRTRTRVTRESKGDLLIPAPPLVLMCIYRFIQEGLNNAFKHAAAQGQNIHAKIDGRKLSIAVADRGPGLHAEALDPGYTASGQGLGLAGLKDRVETLGGTFTISAADDGGTRISALFDLNAFAETAPFKSGTLI